MRRRLSVFDDQAQNPSYANFMESLEDINERRPADLCIFRLCRLRTRQPLIHRIALLHWLRRRLAILTIHHRGNTHISQSVSEAANRHSVNKFNDLFGGLVTRSIEIQICI